MSPISMVVLVIAGVWVLAGFFADRAEPIERIVCISASVVLCGIAVLAEALLHP